MYIYICIYIYIFEEGGTKEQVQFIRPAQGQLTIPSRNRAIARLKVIFCGWEPSKTWRHVVQVSRSRG